ncbi:MAG: sporulation integral membrane protein YtvI [Oscillospiraceae bacterium]|nr:sporulation integral membrane protein YtvI [Oscillospiraceae bacterium]
MSNIRRTLLYIFIAIAFVWLFAAVLLPLTAPFLIGLAVARITEPAAEFLCRHTKLPRGLAAFVCVLLLFVLCIVGIGLLGRTVCTELLGFVRELPNVARALAQPLARLEAWLLSLASRFPDGIGSGLQSGIEDLFRGSSALGEQVYDKLFSFASGLLQKFPAFILALFTTVLASFMSASALPPLRAWLSKKMPQPWQEHLHTFTARLRTSLGCWFKAELKLTAIIFLVLTTGLLLLRVDFPLLFSLLITLVDALPILGAGLFLLPWSLFAFLRGNVYFAIGLLVLYATAALIRQTLEPRLLGKQMGLHPLLSLMAIYIGFCTFGVLGMVLFPIAALLIKQFIDPHTPQRTKS